MSHHCALRYRGPTSQYEAEAHHEDTEVQEAADHESDAETDVRPVEGLVVAVPHRV